MFWEPIFLSAQGLDYQAVVYHIVVENNSTKDKAIQMNGGVLTSLDMLDSL